MIRKKIPEKSNILMGQRLKALRKSRKITQTELAKNIGTSLRMVSAIETAECNATVQFIKNMSTFFGVSTDYILDGKLSISTEDLKMIDMIKHDPKLLSALTNILQSREEINQIAA